MGGMYWEEEERELRSVSFGRLGKLNGVEALILVKDLRKAHAKLVANFNDFPFGDILPTDFNDHRMFA